MLRKTIFSLLLVLSTASESALSNSYVLESFQDVVMAVKEAYGLRLKGELGLCEGATQMPAIIFSVEPKEIMVVGDKVRFSNMHFTLNYPGNPGKPVYEYMHYSLDSNDILTIRLQAMDAKEFTPLETPKELRCTLGRKHGTYFVAF